MKANICENEISAIENLFLLIKTMIDRRERDISIRILQILYEVDMRQITTNIKKPMIAWDKRKVMNRYKTKNS